MLQQLTKKQKILGAILIIIFLIGIGIYGFVSSSTEENSEIYADSENWVNGSENAITNSNKSSGLNGTQNSNANSKDSDQEYVNEDDSKNVNSSKNVNENSVTNSEEDGQEKITVHVAGEVKRSGIYELNVGDRIADAIEIAGGTTSKADLNSINLAYKLEDGQKITIPSKSEKNEEKEYITSESGNTGIVQGNTQNKGGNKKVNINQATQNELETLPGIGPSIASRIVEYREQNGKFQKIEDLKNVKGIGDAKYNNIKEYVTVR